MKNFKLYKHLKAAVSKVDSRPTLQCVHFDEDGSMTATDAHVLLRLENTHHLEKDFNLNLLSMMEDSSSAGYPETKRLIPNESDHQVFITLDEFKRLKVLLKGQKDHVQLIHSKEDDRALLLGSGLNYSFGNLAGDTMDPISFNPEYLFQAADFFCDFLETEGKASLEMDGPLQPVVFKSGAAAYLVTPVRTF